MHFMYFLIHVWRDLQENNIVLTIRFLTCAQRFAGRVVKMEDDALALIGAHAYTATQEEDAKQVKTWLQKLMLI